MEFGPAGEGDIVAIAELWHEGWHAAHATIVPPALVASRQPSEFRARTAKRLPQTRIARINGEIAGFYMLDGDELYQFYVSAAHRGRGLAAQLMARAERDLAGRRAWLACSVGNERAASFYRKAGWQVTREESYPVETAEGAQEVRVWRFEKALGGTA